MGIINILFLSDLHFKNSDLSYAQMLKDCSSAYIKTICSLPETWKPQVVAIAGDIGFTGDKSDYEYFDQVFFSPLLDGLGVDCSHVVLCPGNHDKDDSRIPYRDEQSGLVSWMDVKKIDGYDQKMQRLIYEGYRAMCTKKRFVLDDYAIRPFQNYINFLKNREIPFFDISKYDYKLQEDQIQENASYLYGYRSVEGIDFYVYNSAWDCLHNDNNDKGNLRIGPVRQTIDLMTSRLSISLVHHPEDWMSVEAVSSFQLRREETSNHIDIAVHGHMHSPSINQDEDGDVLFIQLPTWASTDTDFSCWKSYIVRIDLSILTYKRMSIFWHRDCRHIHPTKVDTDTIHHLRLKEKMNKEIRNSQAMLEHLYEMLQNKLRKFIAQNSRDLLKDIIDLITLLIDYIRNSTIFKMNNQLIDIQILGPMNTFYAEARNTLVTIEDEIIDKEIHRPLAAAAQDLLSYFRQSNHPVLTLSNTSK